MTIVRAHDLDRYIALLLSPRALRGDLLTVLAFDAELARIPATVSEPLIGEIRLQWWRDALAPLLTDSGRVGGRAGGGTERTGNPLCDDLLELARRRSLPGSAVHGMIDARSAELAEVPLADEAQLSSYVGKVYGGVSVLLARVLDADGISAGSAQIIDAASRAIGLAAVSRRLVRGSGADLLVPATLWTSEEREGEEGEAGRKRAAARVAQSALSHLERSRAGLTRLPTALRPAILPVSLVPRYAVLAQHADDGPNAGARDINPLVRLWTLWRARHKKIML